MTCNYLRLYTWLLNIWGCILDFYVSEVLYLTSVHLRLYTWLLSIWGCVLDFSPSEAVYLTSNYLRLYSCIFFSMTMMRLFSEITSVSLYLKFGFTQYNITVLLIQSPLVKITVTFIIDISSWKIYEECFFISATLIWETFRSHLSSCSGHPEDFCVFILSWQIDENNLHFTATASLQILLII